MFKKGNFMNSTGLFLLSGHDAATWAPLIFYSKPFQMNWNVGSCRHFLSVLSSVSIPEFMLLISNPSSCTQAKHNGPTLITWTALTGSMSSMYGWKTNLYNTPASLLLHPYLSLHGRKKKPMNIFALQAHQVSVSHLCAEQIYLIVPADSPFQPWGQLWLTRQLQCRL